MKMKIGDLVKCNNYPARNLIGMVLEEESDSNGCSGFWVEFFDDYDLFWYSFEKPHIAYWPDDLEIISEC